MESGKSLEIGLSDGDQNRAEIKPKLDLFCISSIAAKSFPIEDFQPSERWSKCIKLNTLGARILEFCELKGATPSESEVIFAALISSLKGYSLLNTSECNIDEAIKVLSEEIRNGYLRLPNRFGRDLYDKFNDNIEKERPQYLQAVEVDDLLEGCDQGVYQLGHMVTGPLGLTLSEDKRYIPISKSMPLWHCSDTGCGQLHTVDLLKHDTISYQLSEDFIDLFLDENEEIGYDWHYEMIKLCTRRTTNLGRQYSDLPVLIADCINSTERHALCLELLKSEDGKVLRRQLQLHSSVNSHGSPEDVIARLSSNAQLQLLLTIKDETLIRYIDQLVSSKSIRIPLSETRTAKIRPAGVWSSDESSSLSIFGIRSNNRNPAFTLSTALWDAYAKAEQLSDLTWRCQKSAAESFPNSGIIIDYLMLNGPRETIRNLVLPSRPVTLHIAETFRLQIDGKKSEDQLIDHFLWKAGFNPSRYESKYNRIKHQLKNFRDELISHHPQLSDEDRDAIRSSGVNVFVSLENILEEIVSYNLWFLSSDHFVVTKFVYSPSSAVAHVPSVLGPTIVAGGQEFGWNPRGGNTLGTLMVYARAAANWMSSFTDRDREELKRPLKEMPFFAEQFPNQFQFRHRELWADASPIQLKEFAIKFAQLVSDLEKSKLSEVRNGIDHYRDEDRFPSIDAMLACETRISAATDIADLHRFLPKYYWMEEFKRDYYGLSQYILRDYADRRIIIKAPQAIIGLNSPEFNEPILVPFGNILGMSNSEIILSVKEDSIYSRYWSNYPRRITEYTQADRNLDESSKVH